MAKKRAARKRAAHRANDTRQAVTGITQDLVKQARRIATLESRRRQADKLVTKLTEQIQTERQKMKAIADAAVNDKRDNVGALTP